MKENIKGGASFIKLTMDNKSLLCGKGDIPVYTDEQLKLIFEFARENNLAVAGHIHSKFGFDRALQYGIDSMEHTIADAVLTDKEVSAMAKKNIAIVPTIIIAQMLASEEAYSELPKEYRTDFIKNELAIRRQYLQSSLDDYIEPSIHESNVDALGNFQKYGCENMYKKGKFMAKPDIYFDILLRGPKNILKMKDAGVIIGCGTDSGVPLQYHGSLYREMEMLSRIGFSNKEVLRCATINNAAILKMADKIGSIEKGKYADITVLKGNPLTKIETCREPQMVIKDGYIYQTTK
jgi:imidazolonepropionase-like amidohydrolase